jgi:hypothetical protein
MSESKLFEISKNRAILIFTALGFQTANQWDVIRLKKKLMKLHNLIEGAEVDQRTQKRIDGVLRAVNDGCDIVVTDDDNAKENKRIEKEVNEAKERESERKKEAMKKNATKTAKKTGKKVTAKKTGKKVTAKKTGKKVTAKKTTKVEKDKFGSRVGSSKALFNACLTRKLKTMRELVKEAKLTGTYYEHIKTLIKSGHVEKVDGKGFRLK